MLQNKYRYTVITLITNNYEPVREIDNPQDDVEYILVTDDKNLKAKTWKVIYEPEIDKPELSGQEKIYYIKWNKLFNYCNSEYIVRIDGAVQLQHSLDTVINKFIYNEYDIAVMCHPYRTSFEEEYDEWINARDLNPIYKTNFFNLVKMDKPYKGLIETTIMIYKNNDVCKQLCNLVYSLMERNNSLKDKNDQCYFTTLLNSFQYKLKIWVLYEQAIFSTYMRWYYHGTFVPVNRVYNINKPYWSYLFNKPVLCDNLL